MKEMEYSKEISCIILDKGIKDVFYWFILNRGAHPCAYVGVSKDHPFFNKEYDSCNIDVHGGLTFADSDFLFNPIMIEDIWWLGWDYAHAGDHYHYESKSIPLDTGKKWTTEEIKQEVFDVIKQLTKVKK